MVCEDQVETELPAAAERPHARHGSERPLRQSGFLSPEKLKRAVAERSLERTSEVADEAEGVADVAEQIRDGTEVRHISLPD